MIRGEILEYPYRGTITRTIEGVGREPDSSVLIYDGIMDEHIMIDDEGRTMQTASYVISIPLIKNNDGDWIVPCKGDKIVISRYGETFNLTVDNAEPSQLGGVSVYATRNSW